MFGVFNIPLLYKWELVHMKNCLYSKKKTSNCSNFSSWLDLRLTNWGLHCCSEGSKHHPGNNSWEKHHKHSTAQRRFKNLPGRQGEAGGSSSLLYVSRVLWKVLSEAQRNTGTSKRENRSLTCSMTSVALLVGSQDCSWFVPLWELEKSANAFLQKVLSFSVILLVVPVDTPGLCGPPMALPLSFL